jgi:toxin ParE1/3/4
VTVLWTPRAAIDLDEIIDYIAEDKPEAAVRVGDKIRSQTAKLAIPPDIGKKGEISGTRELVIHPWPYIVVYRIDGNTIRIIRLRHGAQLWP